MPANMKGTKTTPLKGSKVTPLKGIKVTPLKGTKVTPLKGTQVTPMKGTKVITMVTPKVTTLTSAALLRFLRRHDQKIPDGDDLRSAMRVHLVNQIAYSVSCTLLGGNLFQCFC